MRQLVLILVVLLLADAAVAAEKSYQLLRFTATWCGPCHKQKQVFKQAKIPSILKKYHIKDVLVDVDANPWAATDWKVSSIPTVILIYVDKRGRGVPVRRYAGTMTAAKFQTFVVPP